MSQLRERRGELVSVVIPAHDEAAGIEHTINEIERVLDGCEIGYEYELIIVDDGSRDGTFEKVLELETRHKGLKGIQFSRNFGKEAALLAGLTASTGDAVITMDADLQHPPELIPELLAKWKDGFQVVHGVKRDRSNDSALVRWRAMAFNYLIGLLGGIIVQHSSDFKLLDRIAVNAVVGQLPETQRFYRGLASWIGFKQTEIPFSVESRNVGYEKWSLPSLFDLATTALVSFTSAPLRIISILGLATLILGVVLAAEALLSWFQGKAVSGYTTIICTVLIIGSFIMISLGIVGEYMAKMYEEIKRRPSYLVTTRCGFEDHAGANRRDNRGQVFHG
jgi:glycosyltransferase involved in cell wall biosynthesis